MFQIKATQLPDLYRVKQLFDRTQESDPGHAVMRELRALGLERLIQPGQRIGITAGSRGIASIVQMIKAAVAFVRSCGGDPFVFAAMGSHGGGTVQGQLEVLHSYGITVESVGAPVLATADTVLLGRSRRGVDVYIDRLAAEADGIIVMNRVKPHTSFFAPNESGLLKMMVVGMGKERGATYFHSLGARELIHMLPDMAEVILTKMPILGGVAIVENSADQTAFVRGIAPINMQAEEAELLQVAYQMMPSLPVDEIDLLVVDQQGKNYSGGGLDSKVIGRVYGLDPEKQRPRIRRITTLDLSDESHGNAIGVALSHTVTKRLVDKIDRAATYANVIATTFLDRAAVPMYFDSDRDAICVAYGSLNTPPVDQVRMIWIKNTLHLEEIWVSAAVLRTMEAERPGRFTVLEGPLPMDFDTDGNLRRAAATTHGR